jgi:hypothetical protein
MTEVVDAEVSSAFGLALIPVGAFIQTFCADFVLSISLEPL